MPKSPLRPLTAAFPALRREAAGVLVVLLVLTVGSCGEGERPRWKHLAHGDAARSLHYVPGTQQYSDAGEGVRLRTEKSEAWLELPLPPANWEPLPMSGVWRAPLALRLVGQVEQGARPYRLTAGSRKFLPFRAHDLTARAAIRRQRYVFFVQGREVFLRLPPNEKPPAGTVLAVRVGDLHTPENERVRGHRFSGDGVVVWPGQELVGEVEFPAGAMLRFATCMEPAFDAPRPDLPPVVFRVRLDSEVVYEHVAPDPNSTAYRWHGVPLPPGGGTARISLEVEGPLARTSFLDPVVGPLDVGHPGKRPWGAARPDIVVFLADTFRADSLAAYGGELALTPHLDRLAREGLVFRRSRSPGTYTLPGHTALFTGLFPLQAGIRDLRRAVPDELTTIAEHLEEWGYRTGAVTDSGIVSQRFGMDQGFAWFDETWTTLDDTVARARDFLEADDGRPVFLFVHTYRTHLRYQVSEETRAKHGARLGIEGTMAELEEILRDEAARQGFPTAAVAVDIPRGFRWTDRARDAVRRMKAFYRGGVIDLDLGFAKLRDVLAARGLLDHGYLVFTSDHGEAFCEHDEAFHGGKVFGEQIRVPLVIAGKGVKARVIDHAVTLVDLAPTLAAMAGTPGNPKWMGTSLLTLDSDRPAFSFQCGSPGEGSTYALIENNRKIIAFEDLEATREERFLGAFDLDADPYELHPITGPDARWPGVLFGRLHPFAESLTEPVVGPQAARLDAAKLSELHDLGYGGD